jgi:hypothetical protein
VVIVVRSEDIARRVGRQRPIAGENADLCAEVGRRSATSLEDYDLMLFIRRSHFGHHGINTFASGGKQAAEKCDRGEQMTTQDFNTQEAMTSR